MNGWLALSPLAVFLVTYLVTSIVCGDFYKVPVASAFLLASIYADQAASARRAIGLIAALIERFHPVMSALLASSGATATAGLMAPSGALASALITKSSSA